MSCDTMYSNAGNYKCISKLQYFQKIMKVYYENVKEFYKQNYYSLRSTPSGIALFVAPNDNPGLNV